MGSGKEGRGRASSSSWELLKQPETCTTAMRFIKRIFLNSNLKSRESVCLLNLLWTESVDEFVNWWYFPCDLVSFHTEENPDEFKASQNASLQITWECSVRSLGRCVWKQKQQNKYINNIGRRSSVLDYQRTWRISVDFPAGCLPVQTFAHLLNIPALKIQSISGYRKFFSSNLQCTPGSWLWSH